MFGWLGRMGGGSFTTLIEFGSLDESGTIKSSCKVTQLPTTSSCIAGKMCSGEDLKAVRHYDVDPTGTVTRNTLPFQLSPNITLLNPISKTCFFNVCTVFYSNFVNVVRRISGKMVKESSCISPLTPTFSNPKRVKHANVGNQVK